MNKKNDSIFNFDKEARFLLADQETTISIRSYNLIIGIVLAWGFFINALMAQYLTPVFMGIDFRVLIIGYFICCFVGILINKKSKNPYISFIGYNLVVIPIGALLCVLLPNFGMSIILKAMILTGMVTLTMIVLSVSFPNLFLGMGRTLFISLLVGLLLEIVATFLLGYRGDIFDWIFVILFSLYIGYDWSKSQAYQKTIDNAVDSALDIYLDIINLFIRILSLLSRKN